MAPGVKGDGMDIDLHGKRFHLHLWGDAKAPPVLMLHGFPEYGGAWSGIAAQMPGFRCVAPDQRGFGRSWAPAEVAAYDLRLLVADMAALIEGLGAPVPVVAHDWGAVVAYGLAMWRPDLVSRLVVVNGVHPGPFQREAAKGGAQSVALAYVGYLRAPQAEARLSRDGFDGLRRVFAADMDMSWLSGPVLDAYRREWARPGRLTGMLNWYRASPLQVAVPGQPLARAHVLSPAQGQVRCPHLVIWGDKDRALLPCSIEGLEAYCPDLQVARIANADHWILHQQPDRAADLILKFLTAPV